MPFGKVQFAIFLQITTEDFIDSKNIGIIKVARIRYWPELKSFALHNFIIGK